MPLNYRGVDIDIFPCDDPSTREFGAMLICTQNEKKVVCTFHVTLRELREKHFFSWRKVDTLAFETIDNKGTKRIESLHMALARYVIETASEPLLGMTHPNSQIRNLANQFKDSWK